MARNTKNTALAPVPNPIDTHSEMLAAVRAFVREHFPKAPASALVVLPGFGLPAVVLATDESGYVPDVVATDCQPRMG